MGWRRSAISGRKRRKRSCGVRFSPSFFETYSGVIAGSNPYASKEENSGPKIGAVYDVKILEYGHRGDARVLLDEFGIHGYIKGHGSKKLDVGSTYPVKIRRVMRKSGVFLCELAEQNPVDVQNQ
jgi:predicted RNA-binding protein with TRAM domain